jgi:hypothetical protein
MKVERRSRVPSLAVAGAGLALVAIEALIEFEFGMSLGDSDRGRTLLALLSLGVVAGGAVFTIATRTSAPGLMNRAITFGCVVVSTVALVGFATNERLAKTERLAEEYKRHAEAVAQANAQQRERHTSTLSWLQNTYAKAKGGERQQLIGAVTELATQPVEVKAIPAKPVGGDAFASVVADLFGIPPRTTQFVIITTIAFLLKALEVSLFANAAKLWPGNERSIRVNSGISCEYSLIFPNVRGIFRNKPAISMASARADWLALGGDGPTRRWKDQAELARRWRRGQSTVSKWLRVWRAEEQEPVSNVVPLRDNS